MVGKVKHSTSTSYLIVFEDGGRSLIAKTKVRRVEPSLEDTEDTSSDKNDKISFQIVKNVNTAVITNSVFQSTITSSENCITVSSSNPNSDVRPATTSTEISISSVSDVSNHLSIPKPDVVILQTDYVTDKPGPTNIGTPDSVSVPSPDTVNIVLYESAITPVEKSEALDKWAVTPRQQRKNNAPDSAKQIRDKKLKKSPVYEDEFFSSATICKNAMIYLMMKSMLFCCHLRMSMETLIMNVEMTQN